ncbi:MAG: N-acetylneuraminate synthase family protein [Alphaproteobacteria bacterium]
MIRRTVTIGGRAVGDDHPCFVTFEAGATHGGVESAKRLIDVAAQVGADAIKFQILDPDRLVADRAQAFSYEVLIDRASARRETVTEPLYDLLARRALPPEAWRALKAHADARGLAFFATIGFADEIDRMVGLGCDSIKIASADIDHLPLIRHAARTGLVVQIDTGNATLGEIETAVDAIRAEGNESIVIHHCPTGYPARTESINLNVIGSLRRMFPYPIAYSDHTPSWAMDVAALALGANVLEKTITEDRTTRSVEHVMSLEPDEARRFIATLREVEAAMGGPSFAPDGATEGEPSVASWRRRAVRRSAYLATPVFAGARLGDLVLDYRRPGFGLSPGFVERHADARLARDLPAGHRLGLGDLTTEGIER